MSAVRWSCAVAALGVTAYLLVQPASADLAAQQYRAAIGLGLWDNGWFAGHHLPGYSLLFPPLGALLGIRLAGAVTAIAATALFAFIAQRRWAPNAAAAAAIWFAAGATATLLSGRLTFLLGVAVGLGAVLALQRARTVLATVLAFATALASPVAGLFLAIAAAGWALADWRERRIWGAAIASGALAPTIALALLFPEGGTEPFVASAFWPGLAAIVLVAAVLPPRELALRVGAAIYALAFVAAFVVATPLGGNVTRLGALLAGPVVLGALLSLDPPNRRRPALLAALAVALAYWQASPAIRDVARAGGDPSTAAAYYAPLIGFLERQDPPADGFRVEIPFTANHWEAAHVAPRVALARGWERQLDRRYGGLFYDGSLTATTYRSWLDEHAVAFVALPDVALDYAARDEARLIESGLPYLRPVWRDAHWRVFAVADAAPLAEDATVSLTPQGFVVDARRRGDLVVRVRHTRWWRVTDGQACVRRGPGGMTRLRILRPGVVRVQARMTGSTCRR